MATTCSPDDDCGGELSVVRVMVSHASSSDSIGNVTDIRNSSEGEASPMEEKQAEELEVTSRTLPEMARLLLLPVAVSKSLDNVPDSSQVIDSTLRLSRSASLGHLRSAVSTSDTEAELMQLRGKISQLREECAAQMAQLELTHTICSKFESQLEQTEMERRVAVAKQANLQETVDNYTERLSEEKQRYHELEGRTTKMAEDLSSQIGLLNDKLLAVNEEIEELRRRFDLIRDVNKSEIHRLEEEYCQLKDKHTSLADSHLKLQSELSQAISAVEQDLTEERMNAAKSNLALSTLREESKRQKKEAAEQEKAFRAEIASLRRQLQLERKDKETALSQLENSRAQVERLEVHLRSKTALAEEKSESLAEANQQKMKMQGKSKEIIRALQKQLEDNEKMLEKTLERSGELEKKVAEQRGQLSNLREQLESSQLVQQDFVQLSQSLQLQLAQVADQRQVLRWEHEAEVATCPKCRKAFSAKRQKEHCYQCGKIYCIKCSTKTVPSLGKTQAIQVCDKCHDIITSDSTLRFNQPAG